MHVARLLEISKEEYDVLPEAVKKALLRNEPLLIMDLNMVNEDIPLCLSYNGEIFDLSRACMNPFCDYNIPGRPHFHSLNNRYVFAGEVAIGNVAVSPVK